MKYFLFLIICIQMIYCQEINSTKVDNVLDDFEKKWISKKISHMVELDQLFRSGTSIIARHKLNEKETMYFFSKYMPKYNVDKENAKLLKKFLEKYEWFTISEFGKETDEKAWAIVQHADFDVTFQKKVLKILEKLYPINETDKTNYALLYDRVAKNENRPQRYGSQVKKVENGKVDFHPIEDRENVDKRRKKMGLPTLAEYEKHILSRFK